MEINFDGIVGPTHNYSGLSYGNVASIKYKQQASNPKQAALQGLAKMKYLMDLGVMQAVLPPQERPHIQTLRDLGFSGADEMILKKASQDAPQLFYACCSSSSMWAANAATISPSADSRDGRLHITPANLVSKLHRTIESSVTADVLRKIFPHECGFVNHPPLLSSVALADEGAANHTRFCRKINEPGVQLFVFGRFAFENAPTLSPARFPARQTFEASAAIARLHELDPNAVVFAQQSPNAIDAGVFHNDVISVGHQNLFVYHEDAFVNTPQVIEEIRQKVAKKCQTEMQFIKVAEDEVPLVDAVNSYLFNSQIVTAKDNSMHLIAPTECLETESVKNFLQHRVSPFAKIHYFNLRESMRNGGGPACLRLRVVLNEKEMAAVHAGVFLTPKLYDLLVVWVERHYRDRLLPEDLADPQLLSESRAALSDLTQLLQLRIN